MEASRSRILDRIVESKRREVEALMPRREELRTRAEAAPATRGFGAALRSREAVRLLAEVKRSSPSAGPIRPDADPVQVARAYERGGAAALSVLTDEPFFGGTLEDLRRVRTGVDLPVLRKDFLIDPLQVWEARAAGADAILLIARILDDALLKEMHELATGLGLDVLVEVHDRSELSRTLSAGARLVGVNNRDLQTFHTDLAHSEELAAEAPGHVTLVAESGIRSRSDVARMGEHGVDAVLVGESLMRQADLETAAAALVGVPKRERAAVV